MRKNKDITLFLILAIAFIPYNVVAQKNLVKPNWQNLDLDEDGLFGVSTEKAYEKLLSGKKPQPVIVAIIDGGVDIQVDDLKHMIWINQDEVRGNNKDDDHNGYVDDINGWNFLGSRKESFQEDNAEIVRSLREAQRKDPNGSETLKLSNTLLNKKTRITSDFIKLNEQRLSIESILKRIGMSNPTLEELKSFHYFNESELNTLVFIVRKMMQSGDCFSEFKREFDRKYQFYKNQIEYVLNINYNPRKSHVEHIFKGQGNNNVKGPYPVHGTHCAGIIAGERNNGVGIDGIANNIKIMSIRTIPEGDYLDQDLSDAIRYAVDNGARIINMSFNKQTSPDKLGVDNAVRYAMDKGVLIVHAAGNEGKEEEIESSFPNRYYKEGGQALAWIEVGASGQYDNENLLAPFSNYGRATTDVFAPGVKITSTYPNNQYETENGTSMAAPIVSGLAALMLSYYPTLTGLEIKNIIMQSVKKVSHDVTNNSGIKVNFSNTCVSGGIVNVFKALEMASKVNEHLKNLPGR